ADVIRQKESLPKGQVGTRNQLLDFVRDNDEVAILLFDDVIGTGTTAERAIGEIAAELRATSLEHKVACILFYVVVGFRDVINKLNDQFKGFATFDAFRRLAEADQAFHKDAGIFDDDEQRS